MRAYKKNLLQITLGAGLAIMLHAPVASAMPVWNFSLLPGTGDIAGPAGTTIGWGYRISNPDPQNFLWLTGVDADPFLNGMADGSLFDYPVVAPNSTITVPYDAATGTGLYALTWNAGAPTGFINGGTFIISADWYDVGENFLQAGLPQSVAYTATVTAVPVPAALWLFGSGLLGLMGSLRRPARGS
jgi:hypothetical protein